MIKIELYTGKKDYITSSGVLYNKEKVLQEFPSALAVPFVVETKEYSSDAQVLQLWLVSFPPFEQLPHEG